MISVEVHSPVLMPGVPRRRRSSRGKRTTIETCEGASLTVETQPDCQTVAVEIARGLGRASLTSRQAREAAYALNDSARLMEQVGHRKAAARRAQAEAREAGCEQLPRVVSLHESGEDGPEGGKL
jgi:hypothetical protein